MVGLNKIHYSGSQIVILLLILNMASATQAAPLIQNGPHPLHGRRTQHLEEMWRIGGFDDDENLLGLIPNAVADGQKNLYLLDTQQKVVLAYDSEGQFLRTLGHEGDGPGELRQPRDVVLMPDGTVGLIQGFPGKIVKVDLDGLPAGEIQFDADPLAGGAFALLKARSRGSHLVIARIEISRDDKQRTANSFIASYDAAGNMLAQYFQGAYTRGLKSLRRNEGESFFSNSWTLSTDGRVWIPPSRNEYLIEVFAADGTLQRTITRQYKPYPRTDLEIKQRRKRMTPWGRNNAKRSWNIQVEPTFRDIMDMRVDAKGQLWVLSSRGAHPHEPGIHSVWDVFDKAGKFDHEVALACEGQAIKDGIIFPGHGLIVVIMGLQDATMANRGRVANDDTESSEAAPLEVICYKIAP